MAALHPLSSTALLSELDLFSVPPTQYSIEKGYETEHRPLATLSSNTPIEFLIPTSPDEYILFSESYLCLKLKINFQPLAEIKEPPWPHVTLCNNLLHSIFSQCKISIANKEITYGCSSYAYRAYFETFLGYSQDSKRSHLTSAGYFDPDTNSAMMFREDELFPGENKLSSKTISLLGKLHTDLTFQSKAIIGGADIKLTLFCNNPDFYIRYTGELPVSVTFEDCSLHVYRVKGTQELVSAHHKGLSIAPVKIPTTRCEIKTITLPANIHDAPVDNIILGQLPRRIVLGIVSNKAFNGYLSEDPFNFKHYNLNYLAVFIDGVQYPSKAFTPDFDKNDYMREYYSLFQALDQNSTSSSINLTRASWKSGNTLYGFNLTPDLSSGGHHLNPIKRGTLSVVMKFKKPLPESAVLIIFCEFDNLIQIFQNRTVTTDY